MLDFYRISDSKADPEFPTEEDYAGSLSFDDVQALALNPGFAFDYYADVRYSSREVAVLYRKLEESLKEGKKREDDGPYERLRSILRGAAEAEEGLVAFGD